MAKSPESFMFTVGKLDAGMAILLGERAHLIEFPSLLLPPGVTTGSIVNIAVQQNHAEETKRDRDFWALQNDILNQYGTDNPEPPKLELRNVTQTSVTLEWPPLKLAATKLRSLDIYRNRQRLAAIPSPLTNTSTKLSGLQLDTPYTFQLVLRTTGGTFASNVLHVRTHTMADTSGVAVCFGTVDDAVLLENARMALREMGARWSDRIEIDTTHFVCTTPAATPSGARAAGNSVSTAPGVEYQKALQMSIPVVQPAWILACHAEKKMVPIHPYYLGATAATPVSAAPFTRPQSMSHAALPSPSPVSASASNARAASRQSMPPPARTPIAPTPKEHVHIPAAADEEDEEEEDDDDDRNGRARKGTMSRTFRFPSPTATAPPPLPASASHETTAASPRPSHTPNAPSEEVALAPPPPPPPPPHATEVPPPPPVEKERPGGDEDEDVGETEEISLN